MPFGRTGVWHRLDDHVFGAERLYQRFRLLANAQIAITQFIGRVGRAQIPSGKVRTHPRKRRIWPHGPFPAIRAMERWSIRPERLHDKSPQGAIRLVRNACCRRSLAEVSAEHGKTTLRLRT